MRNPFRRLSSRGAHGRRRRALLPIATAIAVVAAAAAIAIFEFSGPSSQDSRTTQTTTDEPTTTAVNSHVSTTTSGAPTTTSTTQPANLFESPAVTDFLAGRSGNVTAAVYNEETGTTFEYHPTFTDDTASIIKVDILATLLSQGQKDGAPLSEDEQELATQMIEASNNDAATELWDDAGAQTGVAAFDALVGMPNTVPNYQWGLTTTTALDQVTLVRHVAYPNALLTNASRAYELGLMENIDAGENWGISYGVPSGVTVALKNGWLPESSGWHINSIGFVDGDGKNYVIAVLTDDNPSESYGINTIQGLSSLVWKSIQP